VARLDERDVGQQRPKQENVRPADEGPPPFLGCLLPIGLNNRDVAYGC
jgi:hypothetical protein